MSSRRGDSLNEFLVPVSDVYEDPFQCPSCSSKHVLLEGRWQRDFVVEMKDGQEIKEDLDEQIMKSVQSIVCHACQTRFRIQQDNVLEEKRELQKLREQARLLDSPLKEKSVTIN